MALFGQPTGAPAPFQLPAGFHPGPGSLVPIPSMVDRAQPSLAHMLAAAAAASPHLQHRMRPSLPEQPMNMGDGPVSYRPQQHYPQYRGLGRAAAGY